MANRKANSKVSKGSQKKSTGSAKPADMRAAIRELRRTMPKSQRAAASAKICQSFRELDAFNESNSIAGFLAFDGEADPLGLMLHACTLEKKVFVPIVVGKAKPLVFAPWTPKTSMRKNRFGIMEPDVPVEEYVDGEALDFVVTPLVAFDSKCDRIGMGGGFYDRTFSFVKAARSSGARTAALFGFAFEMQRVERVEPQTWDVRLDSVITELKIYS
jgi:5-formyltetrahydrofolate cyclo-ligase